MTTSTRLGVAAALVDGVLVHGDVGLADGRVAAVGLATDVRTGLAVPGLVDLQVNGFGGVDFLAAGPEDWAVAGRELLRTGVTACVPTFITAPHDDVAAALGRLASVPTLPDGPRWLGAHLEGPWLAPDRAGTHPVDHLRPPDVHALGRLLAAGPVVAVTLAPELAGADALVDLLVGRGVLVMAGHSDADTAAAHAAFDRGVRGVTHLFNAMRPLHHRDPALAGVALARPDVAVALIVDGVHLADDVVRLVAAAAPERFVLVTDAIAAAGRGEGRWRLGEVDVRVRDGQARRADGTLAGSVLTLDRAVRAVVDLGVPLERAVDAATRRPAALLGRSDVGTLRPGSPADVLVLDDALSVDRVLRDGQEAP